MPGHHPRLASYSGQYQDLWPRVVLLGISDGTILQLPQTCDQKLTLAICYD
jgi:hypothetical protein